MLTSSNSMIGSVGDPQGPGHRVNSHTILPHNFYLSTASDGTPSSWTCLLGNKGVLMTQLSTFLLLENNVKHTGLGLSFHTCKMRGLE